jgi:hypothetical protein
MSLSTSLISLTRNVGRVCGVTVAISMFVAVRHHYFVHLHDSYAYSFAMGYRTSLLSGAGIALLAFLISLKKTGGLQPLTE